VQRLTPAEQINFLITNRIPRRSATLFMGWFSKLRSPLLTRLSIAVWRLFADDLRLFEAKQANFISLHDCFIRELKPGARTVDEDPAVLCSPVDAVVGEFGDVQEGQVLQAKGFPYSLDELLGDPDLAARYRNGRFVTLRLKSSMYHRFHAPLAGRTELITYISGDTWNVNPIALKKVERLFCRNERAVVEMCGGSGAETRRVLLVPVAAVLVASMRFKGVDVPLNLRYQGPNRIAWTRSFAKGEEMGYFEHGSTIVLFTTSEFQFDGDLVTGEIVRMGQKLMCRTN
jgi:phosphatidylserine decarboxylase